VTSSLHKLLADGTVRYSQVWEDHTLVEEGLGVGPGDDVLSIASAGCNAFAALLREPKSVLAIDLNPAQLALVELKVRAIESFEWEDFVGLLGITPRTDRVALYERLRPRLSGRACAFWDAHTEDVESGVHACGRLESFFRGFYANVLPGVLPAANVERFLAMDDVAAQAEAFDAEIGVPAMKAAFTSYFTRERLASEGRDPRQMRYVAEMDVAEYFWSRFRWVLTALPARSNFYVSSFLTGGYRDLEAIPPYLRRESFPRLRALLPRLRLELGDVEGVLLAQPESTFSKANLSDLFEYLSDEATDSLFETLGKRLRPGGRICYWNLLVPRSPALAGEGARAHLRPRAELATGLYAHDRSWFYRAFHVEEVSR
jgi:S-adenosylmethionine-diacylglycerol 3-amino-3-carboxypropyl transferase